MIARREGPLGLYAAPPAVAELLAGLGEGVTAPDEAVFDTYMAASASMSSFFALQAALTGWLEGRGATREGASAYVRSLHRALAQTSLETAFTDLPALVAEHETPGGLNQRVRTELERQGWFEALGVALEGLSSLRRADLKTADE
jgi:pyrroline-5-carboxylate reductase